MLVVDAQLRRPNAPVFLEEWIRLGLGLLVVDVHGQYTGYLAQMNPSFGFLAGSREGQDHLTSAQQNKYMAVMSNRDATHVGQNIIDEALQVIFNFASYRNTTEAGTYLLAMLAGIEQKAQEFTTKPCAVLFTDVRPFAPTDEAECVIENSGVAQQVYDLLMSLVEHAGQPGLKHLGICLASASVEGVEEEMVTTSRLWVVNCVDEEEVERVCRYLELTEQEVDQLLDGDTMLFDTTSDGEPNVIRFRRAGIALGSKLRSVDRQTEQLPEEGQEERLGGDSGLRIEEQK